MLVNLTLDDWANISTILGAITAVGVLLYTACQVQQNTRISRGQFWLELEKMFSQHDEIHLKLRPGGEWSKENTGPDPNNAKDWVKVEDYMGLFEHCEIMLEKELIDWETFNAIFSYRLHNIVANKRIVEKKLIEEKGSWEHFTKLLKRLAVQVEPEQRGQQSTN